MELIWVFSKAVLLALGLFLLKWVILKSKFGRVLRLRNLTLEDIANYATVFAVVFGICLAFGVRKQLVQVEKVEDLRLAMFEARQWLTHNPGFDERVVPPFFMYGYVVNDGDKIGVDYALEVGISPRMGRGGAYNPYTAYVFAGTNNVLPPISSLNWLDIWPPGSVEIRNYGAWWRIPLPIVNPGAQVGFAIGLGAKATSDDDRNFLKGKLADILPVRLIKLPNGRTNIQVIDSIGVPLEQLRYYDGRLEHGGT